MGNIVSNHTNKFNRINYEDVQKGITSNNILLINTLDYNNQDCLIHSTISIQQEEETINNFLEQNSDIIIIIYGENSQDEKPFSKYTQLSELGFTNVYIYSGGIFEWLLLQDIYGFKLFPTTKHELNHLQFKGQTNIYNNMIKY